MTLQELSAEYEAAAQPLRDRLRELRYQLQDATDPDVIWHLQRRIAELTPMLTEANHLSWWLGRYYERGGADRDFKYGLNSISKRKEVKPFECTEGNYSYGADSPSAAGFLGVSRSEIERYTDCKAARCAQKHRKPYFEASRSQNRPVHEIPVDLLTTIAESIDKEGD